MAWYIVCLCVGIILGMLIEDITSTEVKYEGKIKQKGQNNSIQIKKSIDDIITKRKEKTSKIKGLFKRKRNK